MRVVAQRVTSASVKVDGVTIGRIAQGLVLFVGIGRQDTADDDSEQIEHNDRLTSPGAHTTAAIPGAARAITLASKVAHLRIFPDAKGKSNLSLLDVKGSALIISQFTLYADCRRGRRPSFTEAAGPAPAETLVEEFRLALQRLGVPTAAGQFGAHMTVSLINDGPYTILLDSDTPAEFQKGFLASIYNRQAQSAADVPNDTAPGDD